MNILLQRHVRILIALALMAVAFGLAWQRLDWDSCFLLAWNIGALAWLGLTFTMMAHTDSRATSLGAQRLKPSTVGTMLVVTVTAVFGFLAAVVLASRSGDRTWMEQSLHFTIGVFAVMEAWLLLHTQFALYYAQLYYDELVLHTPGDADPAGALLPFRKGLEFSDAEIVDYWDFIYYAYTIAMCYQTSDVSLTSPKMRRVTIVHALISFAFVAVLIGFVVNAIGNVS
jgi:uncharacterized membrane protein